jgi:predicted small lipoprotein YifL
MILMLQILVRAGSMATLVTLMACGQQGPLYLPQAGGSQAASLPDSLLPAKSSKAVATSEPVIAPDAKPPSPSTAP